ncbi:MAG: diguanylate cyclase, partial [Pseudomonadota bacterium]
MSQDSTISTAELRRPVAQMAVDPLFAKVAIDLQNLPPAKPDESIRSGLQDFRDATDADAVCVVMTAEGQPKIQTVITARANDALCDPKAFSGMSLNELPWIRQRLSHLRLLELLDCQHQDDLSDFEKQFLISINVRAMILVGFVTDEGNMGFVGLFSQQPKSEWGADLSILMKLVGTCLATGLSRLEAERSLGNVREQMELATFGANDGMWDWDVKAKTIFYSPRWKHMLGYDDDDLEGTEPSWRDLIHPDDLPRVQGIFRQHLDGQSDLFESTHRVRHQRGDWRWVLSRAKALFDDKSSLKRVVGVELDITERKLYEEALFREKESAQITLSSIGDGVITTTDECLVEYLNPVAEELTGWKLDDAAGRPIDEIFRGFHEETCEPLENPLSVSIRRQRPVKSVRPTLLIRRDGNEIYIEHTASPIRDGKGSTTGGVLVFHDVSEARELNRRLSYHASHDMLTGLVNRREFEHRLERALKSARAQESSYALCYLDLDQFKIINDTCGHAAGDTLLSQLGDRLKSKIRWRDTLARMGGDEFGVLLESCTLDEALQSAETLRQAIQDYKFVWDEHTFRLACSIGVVPITAENDDLASLLSAADSACQAAKEAGRNRVHSYERNDIDLLRRRREIQWAARINSALEEGRFELFRQVIRPLQMPDHGAHYELLLRMRDENGALISPGIFISAAERYGIIPNIDRWVVENAFRWLISAA